MKKYLTYRTATILGWIGLALLVASFFIPSPWGLLAGLPGYLLILVDFAASWHQRGYSKGHADARTIVTEEVDRLVAEINQMNKPYLLHVGPIDTNLPRVPVVEDSAAQPFMSKTFRESLAQNFGPNPLEAELNRGLAADKAEEPSLWEALKESRDAEDSNGLVWGTDYWDEILSEPSEAQARSLAKASDSNLYNRQPHCEWVKVEEPRLCDNQNAQLSKSEIKWAEENFAQVYRGTERIFPEQPTAKEHRCQSCGVLTDTTFCEPACGDNK